MRSSDQSGKPLRGIRFGIRGGDDAEKPVDETFDVFVSGLDVRGRRPDASRDEVNDLIVEQFRAKFAGDALAHLSTA